MDHQNVYIGMGMQLAQEPDAMAGYGRLSKERQASLIRFIQSAGSGEEAQTRIAEVVRQLGDGGAPHPPHL